MGNFEYNSLNAMSLCFAFIIRDILGLAFEISQALQKKDQDIVNAIKLVQINK